MAFAAVALTAEPRSYSTGPWKEQLFIYTAASGDVAGTITATALSEVIHVIVDGGLTYTAAPTFSGNAITLAFADPVGNRFGSIRVMGR